MKPCICPNCRENLIVTCPNACPDAHHGASEAFISDDQRGPSEPQQSDRAKARTWNRANRPKVLAAVDNTPRSLAEIVERCGVESNKVSGHLYWLAREGTIVATGERGKSLYHLAPQ